MTSCTNFTDSKPSRPLNGSKKAGNLSQVSAHSSCHGNRTVAAVPDKQSCYKSRLAYLHRNTPTFRNYHPLSNYERRRNFLTNMATTRMFKKFSTFYGTHLFITVFTKSPPLDPTWARLIHSTPPHLVTLRQNCNKIIPSCEKHKNSGGKKKIFAEMVLVRMFTIPF
jgi:hypothetical protein